MYFFGYGGDGRRHSTEKLCCAYAITYYRFKNRRIDKIEIGPMFGVDLTRECIQQSIVTYLRWYDMDWKCENRFLWKPSCCIFSIFIILPVTQTQYLLFYIVYII